MNVDGRAAGLVPSADRDPSEAESSVAPGGPGSSSPGIGRSKLIAAVAAVKELEIGVPPGEGLAPGSGGMPP